VTDGANQASAGSALQVEGLTKSFFGSLALDHVDLDVKRGEAVALAGHNGSGKSTLIKVLAGFHTPNEGDVSVGDEALRFGDPDSSRGIGLRFIHQDLGLVPTLTVLENLKLGTKGYATGFGRRIKWSAERRAARELLERFEVSVSPDLVIGELTAVQRTQVAVARALQDRENARFLVCDEPTAILPGAQVDQLFALIRRVLGEGIGVIYVSHRLEEIYAICSRVTVLRDGKVVAAGPTDQWPRRKMIELITGAPSAVVERPTGEEIAAASTGDEAAMSVTGLRGGDLRSLDFDLNSGEILGLAGLEGSGVHGLSEILTGQVESAAGTITVAGSEIESKTPEELALREVAVLPAETELKVLPTMSLRENLTLPDLRPMWKRGVFSHRRDRREAEVLIDAFDIRPHDPDVEMRTLSGGNRQKACVAKWMRTNPRVFVLDEPTAGVDAGGRAAILKFLREAAAKGMAIVISSADVDDLAEVCNRVIVLREGRAVGELVEAEISSNQIAAECYQEEPA
jgi:ribose transport system ATP-binding protein